jgi:hypothetical protein
MPRRTLALAALLCLFVLVGCGSPAAGLTSAATTTSTHTPTTTATPFPRATTDSDPFQVHFFQHYQIINCPTLPTPTNLCYTLQDDSAASSLGMVSFVGTDILYQRQTDANCGPAERNGALHLTTGDTIAIKGMGTYCVPGYAMQLTFRVTGGTGRYQHASGAGTIAVSVATPQGTANEFWSGAITA